jgi:tetratricopeptide (TPR) repeat protein
MSHPGASSVIGRRLGVYQVQALLGTGGMGEVYRARDTRLGRDVAIKILPRLFTSDPERLVRFEREARMLAALNHPNIGAIYGLEESDGIRALVLELVEGLTVADRLAQGPIPVTEALGIAKQIAHALEAAHEQGIIHRDLKPANIKVTPSRQVKVLDFGLAKYIRNGLTSVTTELRDTLTMPGTVVGTLGYMAPEQLRGRSADVRTDIWALGVVLYEMAAGRLPFAGSNGFETTAAILDASLPPLPDHVPTAISEIIRKCLEKDPTQRYQSAGEVRSALQTASMGRSPFGYALTLLSRVAIATAAVAVAAGLAIVVLGNGVRQWTDRLFSQRVAAFAERDWLLVADFENRTADKAFNKSLDVALTVGLAQSSYVNIVTPSQIEGALRRMKIPTLERIDAATAREIAQREGIKLVLVPSITEVGGVYQLSGLLEDPATGTIRRSASARARHKEDVLNGLDELVQSIRSDLGEARRSISRQGKPLDRVTTSSLEALRLFSLGRDAHRAAQIDEARALYEQALGLDPAFTAARASLGMLTFELGDRERGKQLLEEAVKGVDGLTDREKYTLLAFHAAAIENDPQKAIDNYKALLAIYPDAGAAYNNMGRAYMQMGRYDEAVAALKESLRREPDMMLTYNSLNEIYLRLGDLDAALTLCQQQLRHNDQAEWAYLNLGWVVLGKGDLMQAREAFQKALAINPRQTAALYRVGITYRLERRYQEARETFLKIPAIDPAERAAFYDTGVSSHLMGDERAARSHFTTFRRLVERRIREDSKTSSYYLELAEVLSRLGDHKRAAAAAERAMAFDPNQHLEYANFLVLEGRDDEALQHLQLAFDRGYRNFVWMKVSEDLEPLTGDPRFQALMAKMLKR